MTDGTHQEREACAPDDLTDDERTVLGVLRAHRGRAAAIHKESLAAQAGLSVRHSRQVIAHLIERHGQPIGSASRFPAGYFVVETAEEAAQAAQELRSRIVRLAMRLARLQRNTPADCLAQLRLELEAV